MKRQQLTAVFALLLIAMPLPAGIFPSPTGTASATFPGETSNSTFEITAPAFIYMSMTWTDGGFRREVLGFDEVLVVIQGDGHPTRVASSNPIPVEPSSSVRISIYPHNVGSNGYILWDKNFTSGVAGSWYTAYVNLNMQVLFNSSYSPVQIQFRPYDTATGAGLPIEQFNITAQFAEECINPGFCTSLYLASNETSIGLGRLNTYYGIPMTVRARDYFGNLLYNETRTLRMNETNFCTPMQGSFDPGVIPCGLKSDSFYAWDIPLGVYSTKFYNQKPDQFVRINLHWNGTGAGEEVFGGENNGLFPPWWDSSYTYRERLRINATTSVQNNFDLNLSLPASSLAGKMESDYRDLRVVYWDGTAWKELNRSYDGSKVFFQAQGLGPMPDSPANASWHFEEGTGTTTADSSGNGGTGTLTNGPTWVTDRDGIGSAVNFDGSNDFITVPDSGALDMTTSAITLEAWIKPFASSNNYQILSKATGTGTTARKYGLYLATGNHLGFEVRTSSGTVDMADTSVIPSGIWSHVAATYDGANMKWYVNGVLTKTNAQTGAIVSTPGQALRIGSFTTGVSFFPGAIGDMRLYNYSRTPAQVACDSRAVADARDRGCTVIEAGEVNRDYFIYYGNSLAQAPPTYQTYAAQILSTSGLLAYWNLNESSGTTFADLQAPATNGAWAGGSGTPTVIGGPISNGRFLDGVDDTGSVAIDFSGATNITAEFLFRLDAVPSSDQNYFEYTINFNSQTWGFIFYYDPTNVGYGIYLRGSVGYNGKIYQVPAVGIWHHLVMTWDKTQDVANEITAYLDGAPWAYKSIVGGHANDNPTDTWANSVLYIGARASTTTFSKSNMDEFAIYTTTPTAAIVAAHAKASIGQNGSTVAPVSLDSSAGFEWFMSPGETVERWLNPGYYSVRIATDNTSGVQTVASVGINVTAANYYMISGLNITHFVGDFFQISNQQLILQAALRPDVITIGELLPRNPSELTSPGADLYLLIHPFSILTGTSAYTPPGSGANLTAFAPNMTSDSGDGLLLTTMNVLKDVYVFSGSSTAHVWINATNGTTLWENSTLPPGVTLPGFSGNVYVTSNQSIQVTRVSDFRAIWEFSFRYYPSTKRYEQTLTLNNTDNRTVIQPKWFVGFPENRSINESTAAVKDLDNVVWLTNGQNFEVGHSGFYMDFDALNESTERRFFFTFYDRNDTAAMSTPVLELHEIVKSSFNDDSSYYKGTVTFINGFQTDYRGDIAIRFTCQECPNIKADSIQIVDRNTGHTLDVKEFYPTGAGVIVVSEGVGTVEIGSSKIYDVYVKLTLTGETSGPGIFGPLVNVAGLDLSVFLILVLITIGTLVGAVMVTGKSEKEEIWRNTWLSAFFIFSMITLTLFIAHAQGWVA